jgi:hypothetical protein
MWKSGSIDPRNLNCTNREGEFRQLNSRSSLFAPHSLNKSRDCPRTGLGMAMKKKIRNSLAFKHLPIHGAHIVGQLGPYFITPENAYCSN